MPEVPNYFPADPVVWSALDAAGWSLGYRFDAQALLHRLTADGFVVHRAAECVLRTLGGLVIRPRPGPAPAFRSGPLVMDPYAPPLPEDGEAEAPSAHPVATPPVALPGGWCPVGRWNGSSTVLVDAAGRFLAARAAGDERGLGLGNSLDEALVCVIAARQLPSPVVLTPAP